MEAQIQLPPTVCSDKRLCHVGLVARPVCVCTCMCVCVCMCLYCVCVGVCVSGYLCTVIWCFKMYAHVYNHSFYPCV